MLFRTTRFVLCALVIACSGALISQHAVAQEGATVSDPSVYKAFGEKEGLVKIMDDFLINLKADKRTKPFFEDINEANFKAQLVNQICEVLAGPCKYTGGPMTPVHKQLGINREHFNALVEQLQLAMDKHNVPFTAQNKLLAVLAPMHRNIITK